MRTERQVLPRSGFGPTGCQTRRQDTALFSIGGWRHRLIAAAGLFAGFFCGAGAWAAEAAAAPLPVTGSGLPDAGLSLIRVLGALALVVGLFLGGVWLARNWQRLIVRQGKVRVPELKVLEAKSLGSRQAIYIVGYRQQRLLLASSPTGVTLLTELPQATSAEVEEKPVPTIDFAEAFRHVLGRRS